MWIVIATAWSIGALCVVRDSLRVFGWSTPWLPTFSTSVIAWGLVATLLGLPASATAATALPLGLLAYASVRRRHLPRAGRLLNLDKACRLLFKAGDLVGLGNHMRFRLSPLLTRTVEAADGVDLARDLDDIGLETDVVPRLRNILQHPNGLFVICGPEKGGKTSTAYAMLRDIDFSARRIVTVERQVERLLPGAWQREANQAADLPLAAAVEASLQLDPDVLFVGDVADARTADIVVRESLTGRLVIATIDARNTAEAIDRLMALGVAPRLLQAALIAIFAQSLARSLCGRCKVPAPLDAAVRARLGIPARDPMFLHEARPAGCAACGHSGHGNFIPIGELLIIAGRLRESLNRRLKPAAIQDIARQQGARSLDEAALSRALRGEISLSEARRSTQ